MLKVVIDTNVIISALLFGGQPAEVLRLARKQEIQNITSPAILDEIQGVLIRKFLWEPKLAKETRRWVASFSEMVEPVETVSVIPHAFDNRFLECALAGQATFIISGDHHLIDLKTFQGIIIVNPATFLRLILD